MHEPQLAQGRDLMDTNSSHCFQGTFGYNCRLAFASSCRLMKSLDVKEHPQEGRCNTNPTTDWTNVAFTRCHV